MERFDKLRPILVAENMLEVLREWVHKSHYEEASSNEMRCDA